MSDVAVVASDVADQGVIEVLDRAEVEALRAERDALAGEVGRLRHDRAYELHQLHQEFDSAGVPPSQSILERARAVRREVEDVRMKFEELRQRPAYARRRLPDERRAVGHKFRVGQQKGYVHVGFFEDGSPGELFIKMAKPPEHAGRSALIRAGEEMREAYARVVGVAHDVLSEGMELDEVTRELTVADLGAAVERWRQVVREAVQYHSQAWSMLSGFTDVAAILTSMLLQAGVPLSHIANKMLRLRFEPSGRTSSEEIRSASSVVDYIFQWAMLRFSPRVPVEVAVPEPPTS